jgi:hypothetical protein
MLSSLKILPFVPLLARIQKPQTWGIRKYNRGWGSSSRAWQVQDPDFKPQYHQKTNNKKESPTT